MKPETARQVFIDFTKGVLDRIRDHMDQMEKEKEEENAPKPNNRRQTSNPRVENPNAR